MCMNKIQPADVQSHQAEKFPLQNLCKENSGFKYPVSKFNCTCLVLSSSLLLIPAFRAFSCNVSVLGTVSLLIAIFSANFWYFGIDDWRLTLDKTAAYSGSLCYVAYGISHIVYDNIQGNYAYVAWYLLLSVSTISAYLMSNYKWKIGCSSWVFYHVGFHMLLTLGKFLVVEISSDTCSLL